ncbi:type II toxin-antitoxin system HicA family toxin [candidate division KSB1 bacterium]|nr:type II toxin-antitoxin system HicA family toxin [candidate division KSB1 bacterium]
MPRITPIHWKVLVCIFEKAGFTFDREKSSHIQYTKEGASRPLTIPKYDDVGKDIIHSLLRSANMARSEYFEYLKNCK